MHELFFFIKCEHMAEHLQLLKCGMHKTTARRILHMLILNTMVQEFSNCNFEGIETKYSPGFPGEEEKIFFHNKM